MKQYFCNPVNINYRYQFNKNMMGNGEIQVSREAADPSLLYFKGRYYIFASMTLGVWVSDDMVRWENHRLPDSLPLYDYAPDVRVLGEYVYLSASKRGEICNYYRTKDVLNGPYEEIPGTFDFWDPGLFVDEDGRVYFYWGCASLQPIWGVELDPETMKPLGERQPMLAGDAWTRGYERVGEDNSILPCTEEELEQEFLGFLQMRGITEEQMNQMDPTAATMIKGFLSNAPYIEGAWMNKRRGKYYLQYAFAGTQYNTYGDGVYVSDSPLGPFTAAANNPFSYKPGGFLPGAGHGSTIEDKDGNYWHAATMRISINHNFERRVGLFPAGFDADGEMFCNQRYGDWPLPVDEGKLDPWRDPEWFLLSYGKKATASSQTEGKGAELALDENVRTWWQAANSVSSEHEEWLEVDLEQAYDVRAVQINFADDKIEITVPGEMHVGSDGARYIESRDLVTRWKLEGSVDGQEYFMLTDKSEADTDLTHDFLIWEAGVQVRYLRLTILEVPYGQKPCISGLRAFGIGTGEKPIAPEFTAVRTGDLDMEVTIQSSGAMGYNILWGHEPEKLYHSWMVFGAPNGAAQAEICQRIGALVKGQEYYVRVDAFNENGITEGSTVKSMA